MRRNEPGLCDLNSKTVYECGISLVISPVTHRFIILELLLYNVHCFIDSIQETWNCVNAGDSGHFSCARVNGAT